MIVLKIYYHIMAIIKKIFYKIIYGKHVKFGKGTTFRKGFSLMIDKNAYVVIGDGCFFNNYCSINASSNIEIGNHCMFGENVKIYDHNHVFKYKDKLIENQGYKTGDIKLESNCWVGSNVTILKNVKIGSNSVVAAGAVLSNMIIKDNCILKLDNNYKVEGIKYE